MSTNTNISTSTNESKLTFESNAIRMGGITAAVLIGYTGLAAVAGFLDQIEAGTLDIVILAVGVVLAIRRYKNAKGEKMSYLNGFGTGILTALVASVALGIFFWLLGGTTKSVVALIEATDLFGADLGVLIGGLGIILLGTMTGVITSLVAMQYFKSNEHEEMVESD